jgi:Zn-dependent protease with chaperone function
MRLIYSLFLVLFFSVAVFSQQNLKENFVPLKSKGTLPSLFTENIKNIVKTDINELNKGKEKDKALKSVYLTEANYEIEKIVKSGNTLINDDVTNYLNKLADVVLADNPSLRKQLNIYTLKSPVVNAYSYDKGYIFFDIGIIAQAETEAQLAYILCHEISHYTKKHNITGYVRSKKLDNDLYKGKSAKEILVEKCQYSKEHESEADVEGFRLYEKSNYDFLQAQKAFDVLQYAHLPFELVEFKKSFFENENYKIPQGYFLKEVSSIKNNANEDDTKSTHPNTAKRKLAIAELISNRSNAGRVKNVLGEEQFQYVRDLARFELCRLYLKNRDYGNALYAAYILATKYPDNQYLAQVISKSLYSLMLYKRGDLRYGSDSYMESVPMHGEIESYPQQMYHLIHKMPDNEWTIMTMNYVYRTHKKFPDNKILTALSDSLFTTMGQINWGITDFVRTNKRTEPKTEKKDSVNGTPSSKTDLIATLQKENNFRNYDSAYYKEVFVDLFMSDKEFIGKFPSSGKQETISNYSFKSYSTKEKKKKSKDVVELKKVLALEPFYIVYDSNADLIDHLEGDSRQEDLVSLISKCTKKLDLELITLDPGLISANDADKINDYSIINDWLYERIDGLDNLKENLPIMNTDEVDAVIAKYGTSYVLKTGIATIKGKKKYTVLYSALYDLKTGLRVYLKQEILKARPTKDMISAKVYQLFYELKRS